MLPSQNRLRKKKEFDKVFKKGKSYRNKTLFLKLLENNLEHNRFGFVISKKVSKRANIRNKIRRRLRELAKKELFSFEKKKDVVMIVSPGIEKENFQEIEKMFNDLFKKTK